jgi:hypothetical protein
MFSESVRNNEICENSDLQAKDVEIAKSVQKIQIGFPSKIRKSTNLRKRKPDDWSKQIKQPTKIKTTQNNSKQRLKEVQVKTPETSKFQTYSQSGKTFCPESSCKPTVPILCTTDESKSCSVAVNDLAVSR